MSEVYQIVFLAKVLISALASSFAILLIGKIGLRDEIIMRSRNRLVSQMFSCDFCLSFWTNTALGTYLFCVTGNPKWLVVSIFATPITRLMI